VTWRCVWIFAFWVPLGLSYHLNHCFTFSVPHRCTFQMLLLLLGLLLCLFEELSMDVHWVCICYMECGIIFWGNSVESKRIFQKQKRIIRIMTGTTARTSCRPLFWELQILTLASQYIFSLMRFLSSNLEIYKFNTSIHNLNTKHKLKLHMPAVRLSIYQKSVCCNSIHIYNNLPNDLARLVSSRKHFLIQLKKYLMDNPSYSVEEFIQA